MYAKSSSDKSIEAYNYASTHPVTTTAGRYGNLGYQFSRSKGYDAYIWSRPHLVKAGQRAEIIAKDVLGPRAISALQWGADQAIRGWIVLRSYVGWQRKVYQTVADVDQRDHTTLL